jgi:hypothetical protein
MSNVVEIKKPKGRPVVEGSARQKRLAERAARAAANGGVVKRGRPIAKKAAAIEEIVEEIIYPAFDSTNAQFVEAIA